MVESLPLLMPAAATTWISCGRLDGLDPGPLCHQGTWRTQPWVALWVLPALRLVEARVVAAVVGPSQSHW